MIRINLLGIPRAKRGKRAAAAVSVPSEGPSPVFIGLVLFLAVGAVLGYLYLQVNKEHDKLQNDLKAAIAENTRLADVKATYERNLKQVEAFKLRAQAIEKLQAAQSGPVNLLNLVADTINNTDAVWLQAMTDDGRSIDFTGMALSPDAVADLMVNLQKTGAFRSVEIKETSQDNSVKEIQAFRFELICEKATQGAPSAQSPQSTASKIEKKG
jgi:Tfp pilus assembly protein PilN